MTQTDKVLTILEKHGIMGETGDGLDYVFGIDKVDFLDNLAIGDVADGLIDDLAELFIEDLDNRDTCEELADLLFEIL